MQTSIVNETVRQEEQRRTREAQQHKELTLAKRFARRGNRASRRGGDTR